MSKSNGGNTAFTPTEFQFYSPKEKQSLGTFIYNSKDGTYFGRTPKSWGKFPLALESLTLKQKKKNSNKIKSYLCYLIISSHIQFIYFIY